MEFPQLLSGPVKNTKKCRRYLSVYLLERYSQGSLRRCELLWISSTMLSLPLTRLRLLQQWRPPYTNFTITKIFLCDSANTTTSIFRNSTQCYIMSPLSCLEGLRMDSTQSPQNGFISTTQRTHIVQQTSVTTSSR